jgi:antitoxin component YwqK of YwqJK toxin-antitoxin module
MKSYVISGSWSWICLGAAILTSCVHNEGQKLSDRKVYLNSAALDQTPPGPPSNFTGIWQDWSRDGCLISEISYVSGKKNGPWRSYNSQGIVIFEGEYRNGTKWSGVYVEFDPKTLQVVWAKYKDGKIAMKGDSLEAINKSD